VNSSVEACVSIAPKNTSCELQKCSLVKKSVRHRIICNTYTPIELMR
jgi:hypothetical protein